jgi:hypothetical protein
MPKKVVLTVAVAAALLAGCKTHTRVHPVDADHYLICDSRRDSDIRTKACDGNNPEKGIPKVCLPAGRPIIAIRVHSGPGVLVTCGPRPARPRPHRG